MATLIMALAFGTFAYLLWFFGSLGLVQIIDNFCDPEKWGEILGFKPKENRVTQIVLANKHRKFVFFAVGYAFAIEENPDMVVTHERDRWEIIESKKGYDYRKAHMQGLRLWAFSKAGLYLYRDAFPFRQRPKYKKLNLYKIVDSKLVPIIPHESKYFFHTEVIYGVKVIEVEDATGNPISVTFGIKAIGVNPYIAMVEVEQWDEVMTGTATKTAIANITQYPFLLTNDKFNAIIEGSTGGTGKIKNMAKEIAEEFCNNVLEALNKITIGFRFLEVIIYDISPKEEVAASVFKLYDAANTSKADEMLAVGKKALKKADMEGILEGMKADPTLAPYAALMESKITTLVGLNEFISQLKKGGA